MLTDLKLETEIKDNIYVVEYRGYKILISHPFWSKVYIEKIRTECDFDKAMNIIKIERLNKRNVIPARFASTLPKPHEPTLKSKLCQRACKANAQAEFNVIK